MDELDLGILRELSRDQIVWFGRLDPRLSVAGIARRLAVDRATVGSRLRAWERQGFLRSHEVVASPLLFGARIAGGNLRIGSVAKKPQVLQDLGLVPGVISAVDHLGEWVAVLYAFETAGGLERSRRLVERTAGVVEATPCVPFHAPEPTVAPTPLDWRVLDSLGKAPRGRLQEVAQSAGVTPKTLVRRMERLVRGRAVWYLPVLDFTRYSKATVTRFVLTLKRGSDPSLVAAEAARKIPGMSHLIDASQLVGSAGPLPSVLDIGAHLDSVGHAEDVQRDLQELDFVQEVEILFPRRFYLYRSWFDEHTRAVIARTGRNDSPSVRD
jgi:DNA-binding Lrp family transcriptional regulator